jgi:hypothetical protein
VNWQNHLLGGWTVQQWRSKIDDCSPTAVQFNLCPGDEEGSINCLEACLYLSDDVQGMLVHTARRLLTLPLNCSSRLSTKPGTWLLPVELLILRFEHF